MLAIYLTIGLILIGYYLGKNGLCPAKLKKLILENGIFLTFTDSSFLNIEGDTGKAKLISMKRYKDGYHCYVEKENGEITCYDSCWFKELLYPKVASGLYKDYAID